MRIVIVAAHGSLDPQALGPIPDGAEVTVVSWRGTDVGLADVTTVAVSPPRGLVERARMMLSRIAGVHVLLRSLLRLTPFDEGPWFWRAARRTAALDNAVRGADIVIAIGRDSAFAAWNLARRIQRDSSSLAAVYGYTAGRAAIAEAADRVRP